MNGISDFMDALELAFELEKKRNEKGFVLLKDISLFFASKRFSHSYKAGFIRELISFGILAPKQKIATETGLEVAYYFDLKAFNKIKRDVGF